MDQTFDTQDRALAPGPPAATGDADILPRLAPDSPDRSMIVLQTALALIAAASAILLSQAS